MPDYYLSSDTFAGANRAALLALQRLEAHGRSAWIVGGAVRDALLGLPIGDIDIATEATPEEMHAIFRKERICGDGARWGSLRIELCGRWIEVTTYRTEGAYRNGRSPEQVRYTRSLEEDLVRRDFTINAMAWNPTGGLLDRFGGAADLAHRRLRSVGDPRQSMYEDALRMLRAIRFAVRFDLALEPELQAAIRENAPRIRLLSARRRRGELDAMWLGERPQDAIDRLWEYGLLSALFPEFEACGARERRRAGRCMERMPRTAADRWTGFLFGMTSASSNSLCRRTASFPFRQWSFSAREEKLIRRMLEAADAFFGPLTRGALQPWREALGEHIRSVLFLLEECGAAEAAARVGAQLEQMRREHIPIRRQELAICGDELKKMGYNEGTALGDELAFLFSEVVEGRIPNEGRALKKHAAEHLVSQPAKKKKDRG
ncbi:MAG: hypothetical protein SOR89_04505 [Ndongobacter sp.]|nr:hypothetical protein [Ndongobacter sp.]